MILKMGEKILTIDDTLKEDAAFLYLMDYSITDRKKCDLTIHPSHLLSPPLSLPKYAHNILTSYWYKLVGKLLVLYNF